MRSKRKPTKAGRGPGRLSRPALNKELIELTARIEKQYWLVDAITACNRPNDQAPALEHQVRTALGLQLSAVLQGMNQLTIYAKMIRDAATRAAS